jgi:4-deoxy-L-threo-5-hexosulose-uronate ketol-isomerase
LAKQSSQAQPPLLNSPRPLDVQSMTTDDLRATFLIPKIFNEGALSWTFTDLDRLAVGGVSPTTKVKLENFKQTGADFFLQRREMGIINVGAAGVITVDGKAYELENCSCLYIGMGAKDVSFESKSRKERAKFYINSCPAHQTYPTTMVKQADCNAVHLGSPATANKRTIYQMIHQNGIKSCQLVMGFTHLYEGSVWNTMPPHTHSRRTEIYFYFELGENVVSHFLGPPQNSRHLWVQNEQVALSPSWSIHCGCGTAAYKFIWSMGGENQTFDDMDKFRMLELR